MKKSLIIVKNTLFNKIRNLIMKIFNIRKDIVDLNNENCVTENIDDLNQNLIEKSEIEFKENHEILKKDILTELDSEEYNLEPIEYFDIEDDYIEPEIEYDYKERDKICFFKMYENLKKGNLELTDLSFEDVTKVIVLQEFEKKYLNF